MGRGGVASGGRMEGVGLAEECGDEASLPRFCDGGVAATGDGVGADLGWGSFLASARRSFWA